MMVLACFTRAIRTSEFKGMLRESRESSAEYVVDAVLSVSDPKEYRLQASAIPSF